MIKNKLNGSYYNVIGVKEQSDNSFMIALDRVGDLQTTSIGFVMAESRLQAISDKAWDYDDLMNESIAWMYAKSKARCNG